MQIQLAKVDIEMPAQITVIGSINMDFIAGCPALPAPGETVLGTELMQTPGGKGANQAVAAAKLGGKVTLAASVGDDEIGNRLTGSVAAHGVNTRFVQRASGTASGVALIAVDDQSENFIIVSPGANAKLTPNVVDPAIAGSDPEDVLLLSLETPLASVEHALEASPANYSILNLSPIPTDPGRLLKHVYLVIVNELECARLLGHPLGGRYLPQAIAVGLGALGVRNAIVTRGSKGALVVSELQTEHPTLLEVEAPSVDAVDTTRMWRRLCRCHRFCVGGRRGPRQCRTFCVLRRSLRRYPPRSPTVLPHNR